MDISYKWLRQYTPLTAEPGEYMRKMCMTGNEVTGYANHADRIHNVVVGKVLSVRKHPDADKLSVNSVDVGSGEPIQIVTAATNVFEGALVPVALHNSCLYDGTKITRGKLRGEVSNGMFCSVAELGLTTHDYPGSIEDGILILHEGTPGDDICQVLGLDDTVFTVDVVTNRPDCLSVIGIARESAATFGLPFQVEKPEIASFAPEKASDFLTVSVEAPDLCPRYRARVVKNVKIGPSPKWMIEQLRSCGVRSINNIVDITNYVMLEYGQPMHAFDYACVDGGSIIVRRAASGEVMKTLDGQERKLTEEMLVIADDKKPVAVAGVMGGENSEIKDTTSMVVFESANFFGASVRKTSKALGMRTDASARYEKNLDPNLVVDALDRACQLVEELGAGEILSGVVEVDHSDHSVRTIPLEKDWINSYINASLSEQEMTGILESLGFSVENGVVTVPSFRSDVETKYDLSEEIAKFYGYDNIPSASFKSDISGGGYTEEQKFERELGEALRGVGLSEILTYTFVSPRIYDKLRVPADSPLRNALKISNPLGEDTSVMRTTTLSSMLEVLSRNYNNRNPEAYLYEIGKIYLKNADEAKLPEERKIVTLGFYDYDGKADFFTLKGMAEEVFASLNLKEAEYRPCSDHPSYHPGRTAEIWIDREKIGILGQIHPAVAEAFGLSGEVYCAEISYPLLYASRAAEHVYKPLPKYPAATRDLALLCSEDVYSGEIEKVIRKAGGKNLESVSLFDVYTGRQVKEGYKSLAYALSFRRDDSTMSDEETDRLIENILAALEENGVQIRS